MEESKGHMEHSQYMAPELMNEPPQVSSKCDIWSLGCIMYELAALKAPFADTTWLTLAKKIADEKPSLLPDHFSKNLRDLIMLMIDKEPSKRPSAKEILQIISE